MTQQKEVTPTYFTLSLGHCRKYVYVYYFIKLLTDGHNICIVTVYTN